MEHGRESPGPHPRAGTIAGNATPLALVEARSRWAEPLCCKDLWQERRCRAWTGARVLTEAIPWPDLAVSLMRDEAILFEGLKGNLPEGWALDLRAESVTAWVAILSQVSAPRNGPMFIICRSSDRVGLLVEWVDGSAYPAIVFAELWSILDMVESGIFTFNQACLANVPTEGWANTQH